MLGVLGILSLCQSSFVFPNENSELYIDHTYNIEWFNRVFLINFFCYIKTVIQLFKIQLVRILMAEMF